MCGGLSGGTEISKIERSHVQMVMGKKKKERNHSKTREKNHAMKECTQQIRAPCVTTTQAECQAPIPMLMFNPFTVREGHIDGAQFEIQ